MNMHEWLRERLLADVHSIGTFNRKLAERSVAEFEVSFKELLAHARVRKLMGAFRYEQVESDGLSYDEKAKHGLCKTYIQRLREKVDLYEATGNMEYLADALNYVGLEWQHPYHPNAHFESTERHT